MQKCVLCSVFAFHSAEMCSEFQQSVAQMLKVLLDVVHQPKVVLAAIFEYLSTLVLCLKIHHRAKGHNSLQLRPIELIIGLFYVIFRVEDDKDTPRRSSLQKLVQNRKYRMSDSHHQILGFPHEINLLGEKSDPRRQN